MKNNRFKPAPDGAGLPCNRLPWPQPAGARPGPVDVHQLTLGGKSPAVAQLIIGPLKSPKQRTAVLLMPLFPDLSAANFTKVCRWLAETLAAHYGSKFELVGLKVSERGHGWIPSQDPRVNHNASFITPGCVWVTDHASIKMDY